MNDNESWDSSEERVTVSNLLASMSLGLFLIFLGFVLPEIFPIQLLKPAWQAAFITRIVSSSLFALLGFALLHIAIVVNPANVFLRHRLTTVRHLAIAAAIGFLLLIPLQGFSAWRAYQNVKIQQSQAFDAGSKRLAPLKKAITEAASVSDLQKRLVEQKVNLQLQPSDLTEPLPELKQRIMANLERAEIQLRDRTSGIKPEVIWATAQVSVRNLLSSLGFALAFAAGAQAPRASETLLESLSHRWDSLRGRRRRMGRLPKPTE